MTNIKRYCHFLKIHGHNPNEYAYIKELIEGLIKTGKLTRYTYEGGQKDDMERNKARNDPIVWKKGLIRRIWRSWEEAKGRISYDITSYSLLEAFSDQGTRPRAPLSEESLI